MSGDVFSHVTRVFVFVHVDEIIVINEVDNHVEPY